MNLHPAAHRVLLKQIDFKDLAFSLVPWPEEMVPAPLARSVARAGILHPPLLRAREGGSFQVVAGRRRLLAAGQELCATACLCLVLPPETPELEVLALALEEALVSGPLTPVMRAFFLRKAQTLLNQEQLAHRFYPLLGLPSQAKSSEVCRLLTLEEPLLLALHAGELEEPVALEMTKLSFADRLSLFEVIQLLQLSASDQKKLVDIGRELALRDRRAIIELLASDAVREILSHPGANPAQKTAELMSWLTARRFPRPRGAEEELLRLCSDLSLPAGITLSPAPDFERDEVTIAVKFSSRQALEAAWREIGPLIRKHLPVPDGR